MAAESTVRASDADRDRFADLLREHSVQGRLSADEFADRVGAAYAATTQAELDRLVADLPVPPSRTTEARGHPPATRGTPHGAGVAVGNCGVGMPLPCLLFVLVLVLVVLA